jgi:hypothetical protein
MRVGSLVGKKPRKMTRLGEEKGKFLQTIAQLGRSKKQRMTIETHIKTNRQDG